VAAEEKGGLTKVFVLKRSITPSAAQYSRICDWRKDMKFITIAKAKKITVMDEIFQRAKRSKSPGPSSYKPQFKTVKNIFKIGKDRQLKLFAEVHWRSK
jgi:hypothetical protein